ncbi:hypothetical protein JIN85_16875 [Luteolibacter pohnpeiensis]|uniref:Uncharacterized protein n=1 Tax=Luteolibacter pohnpeiensis TaxID=454153 RepID=A0A934S7H3_9BACT|nr:hypothetical protein [Luteolibacter pohnpeiensis]MBK1884096.1 hypothetical protein [Luteolibacter pohnpeiensis]
MAFTTFQNTPFSEGAPFVLNSGGITLAVGFNVTMGDGTATPLRLTANGVGVTNGGGYTTETRTLATADRVIEYADGSGKLFPVLSASLATDYSNDTVTAEAVPSFSVAVEAGALYEIDALMILQTALATTGVQISLEGPSAQTSYLSAEVEYFTNSAAGTDGITTQLITAFATTVAMNNAATTLPFTMRIRGVLKLTGSTPASPVSLTIKSEVGGSEVTIKAGSLLRFVKIN